MVASHSVAHAQQHTAYCVNCYSNNTLTLWNKTAQWLCKLSAWGQCFHHCLAYGRQYELFATHKSTISRRTCII